jgi:hypothetical protein
VRREPRTFSITWMLVERIVAAHWVQKEPDRGSATAHGRCMNLDNRAQGIQLNALAQTFDNGWQWFNPGDTPGSPDHAGSGQGMQPDVAANVDHVHPGPQNAP